MRLHVRLFVSERDNRRSCAQSSSVFFDSEVSSLLSELRFQQFRFCQTVEVKSDEVHVGRGAFDV